jgi:hypothetical protein
VHQILGFLDGRAFVILDPIDNLAVPAPDHFSRAPGATGDMAIPDIAWSGVCRLLCAATVCKNYENHNKR